MSKRKFSFVDFIHDAITFLSYSIRDSEYALNSFNLFYNCHQWEKKMMSHKCISQAPGLKLKPRAFEEPYSGSSSTVSPQAVLAHLQCDS